MASVPSNSETAEDSQKSEMSEQRGNSAQSGVEAPDPTTGAAVVVLPVVAGPRLAATPALDPGGPAGPAQAFWQCMQHAVARQQQWMRLISEVLHSLAEVFATGTLVVQLLQSRFALDGYVELVFHRDSSEEDGDGRVLESLMLGMELTRFLA